MTNASDIDATPTAEDTDPDSGIMTTGAGNVIHESPDMERIKLRAVKAGYTADPSAAAEWLSNNAQADDSASYWLFAPEAIAWCDDLQVPGRIVDGESVADLVPSMEAGQIQPVVVLVPKKDGAPPVVVAGHRRHMACAIIGQPVRVIPYITENTGPEWISTVLDTVAAENMQREDLTVPQLACFAARRIKPGRNKGGANPQAFAAAIGKSEVYARGLAAIGRDLDKAVMSQWLTDPKSLTYDFAKRLKELPSPKQRAVYAGEESIGQARIDAGLDKAPTPGEADPEDPPAKRPSKKATDTALTVAEELVDTCAPDKKAEVQGFCAGLRAALGMSYTAPVAALAPDMIFGDPE